MAMSKIISQIPKTGQGDTLLSRNIDKFKQRFQRLLIPYLVWPVII